MLVDEVMAVVDVVMRISFQMKMGSGARGADFQTIARASCGDRFWRDILGPDRWQVNENACLRDILTNV